jgi:SAM-dependent methyltransferase
MVVANVGTDAMTDDAGGNAAQIAYWNAAAAATWTALQARLDALFAPISQAALAAAAPAAGEAVLDIGCGCGATILALAECVGPGGRVLGLDVSEPMAARARERIGEAGLGNATVLVADAAAHRFAWPADLLFSRFGVMFFADPVTAFANLRSGVRPDGRLLCAVWRTPADNLWLTVPFQAALPVLPPQPPTEPDAPGPFAFADPGRVEAILMGAGWRDVALRRQDVTMLMAPPGGLEEATDFAMRLGPLARILRESDPALEAPVRAAVRSAITAHDGPHGVTFGGSIWLVSARA